MKKCKQCNRDLPKNTDYYYKKKDTPDGYANKCKECNGSSFTNKLSKIPKEGYKFCIKCDRELKFDKAHFPVDNACKFGLRNYCRECDGGSFKPADYTVKKIWSEKENSEFIERYPLYTNEELIEIFYPKLNLKSLMDKAYLLRVQKSEETRLRSRKIQAEKMSGVFSPLYNYPRSSETRKKISIANKGKRVGEDNYWFGKKRSEDQKKYISKIKSLDGKWKGNNNPRHIKPLEGSENGRWQGGITPIHAKLRNSNEYLEWKISVFRRDDYMCQHCGSKSNLEAHHIENFSAHPEKRFEISNGITMCKLCHNPINKGSFHHTYGTYNNTYEQIQEYFKGASWCVTNRKILKENVDYHLAPSLFFV